MGLFETIYIPKTVVPPRRITDKSIKPREKQAKCCAKCGAALIEGKGFCVECGAPRVQRHTLSMGEGQVKALEVAAYLNQWLAENPYLYDVELDCQFHYFSNDLDRLGQITVSDVKLTFSLADEPTNIQYGVEYFYVYKATLNLMEQRNSQAKDAVQQWQNINPHLKYRSFTGGKITGSNNTYQLYGLLLYSVSESPDLRLPEKPAPVVRFCRHCGHKITPGAVFCSGCGQKL